MQGLELDYVGERGGKDPRSQMMASLERQRQLLTIVAEFGPDISVSTASADCARISFGLRLGHLAVNDSPHSSIAAKLSLPLTFHLACPWLIPYSAWSPYGLMKENITRYRALDPVAWLKRQPPGEVSLPLDPKKKTITVRLEESYAPYMLGTKGDWVGEVLRRVANSFPEQNLVALCRYDEQLRDIKEKFGDSYIVPEDVIDGTALLRSTDVFIGMGGTMTAEAALLGVPAISAFQKEYLIERFLILQGLVVKARSPGGVVNAVRLLLDERKRNIIKAKAQKLLNSMEDPAQKVAGLVESLKLPN